MKLLLLTVGSDGRCLVNHFDLIDQYFNSIFPYLLLLRSTMIFNGNKTILLRTVIDLCVRACVRACVCVCTRDCLRMCIRVLIGNRFTRQTAAEMIKPNHMLIMVKCVN